MLSDEQADSYKGHFTIKLITSISQGPFYNDILSDLSRLFENLKNLK